MSDATEQADFRRKKMIEYNAALADFKLELQEQNTKKKDKILNLARILEEAGHDKEKISAQVTHDLKGQMDSSWIRKILGDEYKDKKHANKESVINHASELDNNVTEESSIDEPKKLLVGANGQTLTEDPEHADEESNPIDEIYGGKSRELMKREADTEIQEDKEETLENPANRIPLISDIPPELREKLAKVEEQDQLIAQLVEDRDHAVREQADIRKKYNLLKGGSIAEDLHRLKAENNNLRTLMADIDKEYLEKEGYKEIEVLKLYPETIRLLNEVSGKSQKTFFLLVHPKTMQIKGAKTDVQMHQIQAKRRERISTA